jgi:hypothetical protein
MEMLFMYAIDYMLSGNDKECPDLTDKQTLCHSMSYSNPLSQIDDFNSAVNEGEHTRHVTDDIATRNKNHSAGCARSEASTLVVS